MPQTTTTEQSETRARAAAKQASAEASQTSGQQAPNTSEASADEVGELLTGPDPKAMSFEDALAQLNQDVGVGIPEGERQKQAEQEASAEASAEASDGDPIDELLQQEEGAEDADAESQDDPAAQPEDTGAEDADAEDADAAEPEGQRSDLLTQAKEEFEDLQGIDSEEAFLDAYRQERKSNDNVVAVLDADESGALSEMLYDLIQQHKAGKPIDVQGVARKHLGEQFDALPDPTKDPEGYKQALREQARREAKLEQQQEQAQRYQKQMEARLQTVRERVQESIDQLKNEFDLDGQELASTKASIKQFVSGDSEGLPPKNLASVLYKGINADTLIQQAREEGRIEGRNEAHDQHKEKRQGIGDGIHKFGSRSSSSEQDMTAESRDLLEFTRSLQHNNDPLRNL